MHRSVLALFFAAVLLLSGCAAGRQTVPKEKSGQETNMGGQAFDRSDEEITYMDTTDNVIYLAGGCFWGMEQLMQSIPALSTPRAATPTAPARRTPTTKPSARATRAFGKRCGWNTTPSR